MCLDSLAIHTKQTSVPVAGTERSWQGKGLRSSTVAQDNPDPRSMNAERMGTRPDVHDPEVEGQDQSAGRSPGNTHIFFFSCICFYYACLSPPPPTPPRPRENVKYRE